MRHAIAAAAAATVAAICYVAIDCCADVTPTTGYILLARYAVMR